jgi:hypothetical protein
VNLSAAYTHAVKLCQQGVAPQQEPPAVQQLLSELHELAMRLQGQLLARQLANIIHSSSKLSSPDTAKLLLPLFLQTKILQRPAQAEPQGVSSVAWAAVTLRLQLTEAEVQQLLDRCTADNLAATPQTVSNMVAVSGYTGSVVGWVVWKQVLMVFDM